MGGSPLAAMAFRISHINVINGSPIEWQERHTFRTDMSGHGEMSNAALLCVRFPCDFVGCAKRNPHSLLPKQCSAHFFLSARDPSARGRVSVIFITVNFRKCAVL